MYKLTFIGDRKALEVIKKRHRATTKKRGFLVSLEPLEAKEAVVEEIIEAPTEEKQAEETQNVTEAQTESVETSNQDEDKTGDLTQLKEEPKAEEPKTRRKRGRKPKNS